MMSNKFAAMDRQIKLIRSEFNIVTDKLISRSGFVQQTDFEWEPVNNQEDLDNIECRLAEPEFKKNFSKYLDNQHSSEGSDERLHDAMDIFFNREFVTKLSWTGIERPNAKICFKKYVNVINQFKELGTFGGVTPFVIRHYNRFAVLACLRSVRNRSRSRALALMADASTPSCHLNLGLPRLLCLCGRPKKTDYDYGSINNCVCLYYPN